MAATKGESRRGGMNDYDKENSDILMMSDSTKRIQAQESRGSPPVDYVQRSHRSAPIVLSQNLQFKGFGGGVPPNTERAAVKPRVGIE